MKSEYMMPFSLHFYLLFLGSVSSGPKEILPLFQGGTFNETYNTRQKPINFTLPAGTDKVIHGYLFIIIYLSLRILKSDWIMIEAIFVL